MLSILEGYDLQSLGYGSADFLHLFIEAKKLAFADRAKFYADQNSICYPFQSSYRSHMQPSNGQDRYRLSCIRCDCG